MDAAPAQDSSNHILNALNNDCIQECFRRLTNLRDFLSVAEVCMDFQANAKQCYPSIFKKVIIHDWFYLAYPNGLPSDHVKKFLIIFGRYIDSIEWTSIDSVYVDKLTCVARDQKNDQEILNVIADFCGKTLTKLEIHNHISNFITRSPLKILKELTLNNSPPLNFELHLQLTCLKLIRYSIVGNWLIRQFPLLKKLSLHSMNDLTDEMIIELFTLNPQLQTIEVSRCDQVTTAIFKNIGNRLKNLKEVYFNAPNLVIDKNLRDLSEVKDLKRLTILCKCDSTGTLIDRLAENNVQIEYLALGEVTQNISFSLAKLTQLKHLKLSEVSDNMLINIVKRSTALEKLDVNSREMTFNGIRNALECVQKLKEISICIENATNPIQIDLFMYNSLLQLAKDRLKVQMKIYFGTTKVTKDIQNTNCKWLNIVNTFYCTRTEEITA